ncbi:MAG TPA: hypothetical protein VMW56_13730 [Candidatus Margulisiibacteriota bacterium]|nr:hypothetical protein [Candidatus Margulisiibacteriota bacterium]
MRLRLWTAASLTGCICVVALLGCGDDSDSTPPAPTPTRTATATPTVRPSSVVVFNGENNRLNAYDPADGFRKQTVVPSNADAPGGVGRDLNGQICFRRDAQGLHFIGGEDTNQGAGHATAGWGYFTLTGTRVGDFHYQEIGKLIPTYQQTPDEAENYGCGFLSDGRLVTTDVGNQASGDGNGQLIMWFPPFDTGAEYTDTGVIPTHPAHYCKLDIAIGTAGGIYIDAQDRIYVASARVDPGIFRYTGPFPTSDDAAGGCGQHDDTGAPMADTVNKTKFIRSDGSAQTPNAIVPSPQGTFYVSSVFNGVIAEYAANGSFVRRILSPAANDHTLPFMTGTPLGLGIDSSGTVYYADIGIVVSTGGIGPGRNKGTVRRIRFVNGQPQAPETMDTGLAFPDGIGVLEQ